MKTRIMRITQHLTFLAVTLLLMLTCWQPAPEEVSIPRWVQSGDAP